MITFLKFFVLDSKWAHLVQLDIVFFIRKKEVGILDAYAVACVMWGGLYIRNPRKYNSSPGCN